MTLSELRAAAERAKDDDIYHYEYADHVSPEIVLALIHDRDVLLGALKRIIDERSKKGRLDHPVALIAIAAVQSSEDLWPEQELNQY